MQGNSIGAIQTKQQPFRNLLQVDKDEQDFERGGGGGETESCANMKQEEEQMLNQTRTFWKQQQQNVFQIHISNDSLQPNNDHDILFFLLINILQEVFIPT